MAATECIVCDYCQFKTEVPGVYREPTLGVIGHYTEYPTVDSFCNRVIDTDGNHPMIGLGVDFVTFKAAEGKVGINGFIGCEQFASNGKPADPSDIAAMQRMIRFKGRSYDVLLNNIPTI